MHFFDLQIKFLDNVYKLTSSHRVIKSLTVGLVGTLRKDLCFQKESIL